MESNIKNIKQKALPILKRHRVNRAALFGSSIKGTMKKGSDIDILVDIKRNISLLDFIGIKLELEEKLERKVDLVEYNTIKPLLRDRILKEQVKIL
jgi:predicted nucleotidyltransferase